ncbi:MAG: AI-2E family transporter [Acidobacteriaceae bacterium]
MEDGHTIHISVSSVIKILAVLLFAWFLFLIKDILLLLLISIIISSAMDPLADALRKRHIPRSISVLLVYILFLGVVGFIIYLLIPPISEQIKEISNTNFFADIVSKLGLYRENLNHLGFGTSLENSVRQWLGGFSTTLFNTTRGVVTGFFSAITVLVISFYLTIEENGVKNIIKQLTPFKHQAYVAGLITKIQKKIGYWVLGQAILSFVIFALTFIGLSILKVKFALVLALVAGLLEIVPYIGPFISLLPGAFFAFIQSPTLALFVIILYIVVQQIENHIIVPVVMSKSVGLNPVVVILGVLVGATLGGILGAILAVPVISGISVFIEDVWGKERA